MAEALTDADIFSSLSDEGTGGIDSQDVNVNVKENDLGEDPVITGATSNEDPSEFNLIEEVLKSKGFKDSNSIKMYDDETGTIRTVPFDELSNEEKLGILNLSPDEADLDDEETSVINFMRENELTMDELVNYYKKQGIIEYLQNEGKTYSVDSLSDDELYGEYLKELYGGVLSDEDIAVKIETDKQNLEVFEKLTKTIRESAKEKERLAEEEANKPDPNEEEKMKALLDSVRNSGKEVKTIGGFDLEDEDIETAVTYLSKKTLAGTSKFIADLNDPEQLFKLAFYMTNGDGLITAIHEQYDNLLNDEKYLKDRLEKLNKTKKPKSNNQSSLVQKGNHKTDSKGLMDIKSALASLKD